MAPNPRPHPGGQPAGRGSAPAETAASRRRDLMLTVRTLSAVSDRMAHAFAARHRLHPTDVRALLEVTEAEAAGRPLTAGALGGRLGLTSGAVTGVVDRLVTSGHLVRRQDPADRRRVLLVQSPSGRSTAWSFFGPLGERGGRVMDGFDDDDLAVIERFLTELTSAFSDHLDELGDSDA